MNSYSRAVRYLTRKKSKSLILFIIYLVIGITILSSLFILDTIEVVRKEIQMKTNTKISMSQAGYSILSEEIELVLNNEENILWVNRTNSIDVRPENFIGILGYDESNLSEPSIKLHGYDDLESDGPFSEELLRLIEGDMITPNDINSIVINHRLAQRNGLSLGDTLTFVKDDYIASGKIIGIYKSVENEDSQSDAITSIYRIENQVYTDIHLIESLGLADKYENVYFYIQDPGKIENTKNEILELLGDTYSLSSYDSLYRRMEINLSNIKNITVFTLLLTIISTFIALIILLCMWIRNRIKEIAVLMSLGESRFEIYLQFFLEVFLLSFISYLLSIMISGAISKLIVNKLFDGISSIDMNMLGNGIGNTNMLILIVLINILNIIAVFLAMLPIIKMNPKQILSKNE